MKRILLTSGGLTNTLKSVFGENINKEPCETKIIFIPSAATENDEAREGISMSIYKFMEMGIQMQNIFIYNLKYLLSKDYSRTFEEGLKYIENNIYVHCPQGTTCGKIETDEDIFLTNEQAVWINDDSACVIE